MQPILHLIRAGANAFTYSLSAPVTDPAPCPQELFHSTDRCLYDAGSSLQNYFESVSIRWDGVALGSYPVSRLVQDPLGLFDELVHGLSQSARQDQRLSASTESVGC